MELNLLSPAKGSVKTRKRVGRGIGCGNGKTCGRGHKGQHSRSGGFHKTGFEGGQMPLQRRLPKVGFRSRKKLVTAELSLNDLAKVDAEIITIDTLKAAGVVSKKTLFAKVIKSGEIGKAVKLNGIRVSKGALESIEAAGGSIEA